MNDAPRADFHTHTTHSDGCLTPAALVEKAGRAGLQTLAITDHDTTDGLAEGLAAGRRHGVGLVPGVEVSAVVDGQEVHLLGYFFDPGHAPLQERLQALQRHRIGRVHQIVERLRVLGVPLAFEDVVEQASGQVLGRLHVAAALVKEGYVASHSEAFERYLGPGRAAFVEKAAVPGEEALDLLHEAGGVGVLAHPGHWMRGDTFQTLIRAGLDGIETVHPAHDASLARYYRQLAQAHGLLQTGGSDYHGTRPGEEARFGVYGMPHAHVEHARLRAARRTPAHTEAPARAA